MGITGNVLTENESDLEKTAWRIFTICMVLSLRKQMHLQNRSDAPHLENVQQYFRADVVQQSFLEL